MQFLPEVRHQELNLSMSGADLLKAAKGKKGKAPGPGAWEAESLLQLPTDWWDATAALWNATAVDRGPRCGNS